MPVENLEKHLSFMRELDGALNEALEEYADADEADLEELLHMQREVRQARRSIFIYVQKKRLKHRNAEKKLSKLLADNQDIDSGRVSVNLSDVDAVAAQ